MKRTNHPIIKEDDFTDADDELLKVGVGNALPEFIDRLGGFKKLTRGDEEEE